MLGARLLCGGALQKGHLLGRHRRHLSKRGLSRHTNGMFGTIFINVQQVSIPGAGVRVTVSSALVLEGGASPSAPPESLGCGGKMPWLQARWGA